MKKSLPILATVLILLTGVRAGQAQGTGPLVIIQGTPDTTTQPPNVRTYVSVIDWTTGATIEGLTADDFRVEEVETGVGALEVSYEAVGLAVVVVVDRGGIAAPGDTRIREATDLVRGLVERLSVTGAPNDDMVAIVGVGEGGALEPEADFSYNPVDTNLVLNTLVTMEGEAVRGGTPLYEGLDEALRLLVENPDATIRDVLSHRRRIIVVFSDGIDPDFSDAAREDDIVRKALDNDISIYTIGMARRNAQLTAESNLVHLAHQTRGIYQLHNNDATHQAVLKMFDDLVTQRQQYLVAYPTHLPKGDYTLRVTVDTPIGSAEDSGPFHSILELPRMSLTYPADGQRVTIPYSQTIGGPAPTTVPLNVQITYVDGVTREPDRVRYYANNEYIGSGYPPTFEFAWQVSDLITPTEGVVDEYTLTAEADDPYLGQTYRTAASVTVEIAWEAPPFPVQLLLWLTTYWWLLVILVALGLGLLVLLVMLVRTRGELARRVVTRTTGVLKGVTRRLGAMPQRAPGKLVVLQGANMGKEFRLAAPVIKVGRDPQFCDFALYDEFVSNPHFSIVLEHTQFYITDEGSTNGTRVNGVPIPPHQRMLLQPDAVIEVGATRLQFKRLGGTTRQLGSLGDVAGPARQHPPTAPGGGAPSPGVQPGGGPGPSASGRGGTTRQV